MSRYSEGFRERAVQMMTAPNAMTVAQVSRETGVSSQTLYNWRDRYRQKGKAVAADASNPEQWSGENKLAVVVETAALNAEELAAYCRRKGLFAEQVARWREAAIAGAESQQGLSGAERQDLQRERKRNRELEKELKRKNAALAEAAALLVLQKKSGPSGGTTGKADRPAGPSDGHHIDRGSGGCGGAMP